jgi:hypothetical protein
MGSSWVVVHGMLGPTVIIQGGYSRLSTVLQGRTEACNIENQVVSRNIAALAPQIAPLQVNPYQPTIYFR